MAQLLEEAASGAISGHVHAIYPLDSFIDALGTISRREAIGKVLLAINPD
jgi:NADPH2:quinone reductase